jgi:nucleotide-binding universal stress UspA family protein
MAAETIVVGIDGSHSSQHALRWAITEARLRGAAVEAVQVWHYPAWTYSPLILSTPVVAQDDLIAEAHGILNQAVDDVLAAEHDPPEVEHTVLQGAAAEQLVKHAASANLLVVGHRGRGGFGGLLLGSVANQCAAHATCPVVIVR